MLHLRLIQDKIQNLIEDISTALKIDVTVVDENYIRIGATGEYHEQINQCIPNNSIFADVLSSGKFRINIVKNENEKCHECSNYYKCEERGHMAYPIIVDKKSIGVVAFIAFSEEKRELMFSKQEEYFNILHHVAEMIENEVENVMVYNKLSIEVAVVNEIINSINKGIIIVHEEKITHINVKALNILKINPSREQVIGKKITNIITNMKKVPMPNKERLETWETKNSAIKVMCTVNELVLDKKTTSIMISFDELREIISKAMNYTSNDNIDFSNIIGNSEKLLKSIEKAKIAARSDATIFIQGESGTGKELFARAIHSNGNRKQEPFVAVNCASIPENLLETELFGYEKGSFTGADTKGKIGKFELANNGTLFLDEIADLPLHLQPKLLRVLQDHEIVRVGGNTRVKVNIRIIVATHCDIEELVTSKLFRHDLFYRLNVIPLHLPPLRERESDILICSEYILERLCHKMEIPQKRISKQVEQQFLAYNWLGNIRELENVLEYAVNFSEGEEIAYNDLPDYFFKQQTKDSFMQDPAPGENLEDVVNRFEQHFLNNQLKQYGDSTESKKIIAKNLGISLTTLYRKLNIKQ